MSTLITNKDSASARACVNFALSKYWGKKSNAVQQPAVPSVSIGIEGLEAHAEVSFKTSLAEDTIFLGGRAADPGTCIKVSAVLDHIRAISGRNLFAEVRSETNFPIQAGLASSAAGLAAVSAAAWSAAGLDIGELGSIADCARLGSGSASRSIHGGFVAWEPTAQGSTVRAIAPATHWPLELCLVRLSAEAKKVPSREGMKQAQETSPMWDAWVSKAKEDAATIEQAVVEKNFEMLAETAEANCLLMHATTITARPPVYYLKPESWKVIRTVEELRSNGLPCFFTADAGPNIKVFTLPGRGTDLQDALLEKLGSETHLALLTSGGAVQWGKE
jgi:diphosphomevalonate decarboxylase